MEIVRTPPDDNVRADILAAKQELRRLTKMVEVAVTGLVHAADALKEVERLLIGEGWVGLRQDEAEKK